MTDAAAAILDRLDAIGTSLADEPDALALIGLGSVGREIDRLDEYSDIDFFAIVRAGCGPRFRDSLHWLERIAPIAYRFRNTAHGYKLLFVDGIFCEFAVFEPAELAAAAFPPGRVVWRSDAFPAERAEPQVPVPEAHSATVDHLVNEAVTNLYVGLLRERRGERMAAFRMIQGYALDRIMELAERLEPATDSHRDPFGPERRFEVRCPRTARMLAELAPGYRHNRAAAAACLAFLRSEFDVDPAMQASIETLLGAP